MTSTQTPPDSLQLLAKYLLPQRKRVLVLAVLLAVSIGAQLAIPQLLKTFIDGVSGGAADFRVLGTLAIAFLGVALLQQVASVVTTYVSETVAWASTNLLRGDLARHCLDLDMPFHNQRTPGEMIERIDGDVSALANLFSQFVVRVGANAVMLVGAIVLLLREDLRIGGVLSAFAVLTLGVLIALRRFTVPWFTAEREIFTKLYGFLEERLHGIEDIRSSGAVPHTLGLLEDITRRAFGISMKASLGANLGVTLSFLLFALGVAAGVAVAVYLFVQGNVTIGTVYLTLQYANLMQRPIEEITREIEGFQQASASIGRIHELFSLRRDVTEPEHDIALRSRAPLSVTFDRVTFGYNDATVLRDVHFELAPGQVLGLLGRTGSGKSTIARLLFRLYDPTQGAVRLDGVDLRALKLAQLRASVGMVTQEVQLFHATLRDNLTFFDRAIDDARIRRVIDDLGMGGWFAALPAGLDTELQAGGAGLSAGEAQLIAFARVFLRDQHVVVLDEATSRLDLASEQLIEHAIDALLADRSRTLIIVAHRLSTVQRADAIMILEDGAIVEHGPRSALQADPSSRFSELLRVGYESVDDASVDAASVDDTRAGARQEAA